MSSGPAVVSKSSFIAENKPGVFALRCISFADLNWYQTSSKQKKTFAGS